MIVLSASRNVTAIYFAPSFLGAVSRPLAASRSLVHTPIIYILAAYAATRTYGSVAKAVFGIYKRLGV